MERWWSALPLTGPANDRLLSPRRAAPAPKGVSRGPDRPKETPDSCFFLVRVWAEDYRHSQVGMR